MKMSSLKLVLLSIAALGTLASAPSFAADEVQLAHSRFNFAGYGCGNCRSFDIAAKTKAMGTAESVLIHYTLDGVTWKNATATRAVKNSDGTSMWRGYVGATSATSAARFVIKYTASGKSYWDNNGGKNYTLGQQLGRNFNVVQQVSATQGSCDGKKISLNGNILVKHLGNPKQVGIKYSVDNWKTSNTFAASYSYPIPGTTNTEVWSFATPYYTPATADNTVSYAVYYTYNGKTYWDNNFSANYIGGGCNY